MSGKKKHLEDPCDVRVTCKRQYTPVTEEDGELQGSQGLDPDEIPPEGDTWKYMDEMGMFHPPQQWRPPIRPVHDVVGSDYIVVINGRRGTGKSFMIRSIVFRMREKIKAWFVFTSTKFNQFYQSELGICEKRIFDGVRIGVLHRLLDIQQKKTESVKSGEMTKEEASIGIILDDIGDEVSKMRYSKAMDEIFFNGRHLNVFMIVAEQYFKFIGPGARKNTDVPVIFNPQSAAEKDAIRENYFGFYDKKTAYRSFEDYTRPHVLKSQTGNPVYEKKKSGNIDRVPVPYAIAMDARKSSRCNNRAECMFLTYADDPPPFLASCAEEWDQCEECPEEAYKECCRVYEERQQRYCDEKGKPCQVAKPYRRTLSEEDEEDEEE
jgi:hypothetical protein